MGLKAGDLRDRITIERQVTTIDSAGDQVVNWEQVGKFWASILPLSARELISAEAIKSEVRVRIVMRYKATITASMRVLSSDGQVFNIEGVIRDNESGREWMTLPCTQNINQG